MRRSTCASTSSTRTIPSTRGEVGTAACRRSSTEEDARPFTTMRHGSTSSRHGRRRRPPPSTTCASDLWSMPTASFPMYNENVHYSYDTETVDLTGSEGVAYLLYAAAPASAYVCAVRLCVCVCVCVCACRFRRSPSVFVPTARQRHYDASHGPPLVRNTHTHAGRGLATLLRRQVHDRLLVRRRRHVERGERERHHARGRRSVPRRRSSSRRRRRRRRRLSRRRAALARARGGDDARSERIGDGASLVRPVLLTRHAGCVPALSPILLRARSRSRGSAAVGCCHGLVTVGSVSVSPPPLPQNQGRRRSTRTSARGPSTAIPSPSRSRPRRPRSRS